MSDKELAATLREKTEFLAPHFKPGFLQTEHAVFQFQFDEAKRDAIIAEIQKKVDVLQEEVDMYNYTTNSDDCQGGLTLDTTYIF